MGRRFTEHELNTIRQLSNQLTVNQIGELIGRTGVAVYDAARYHGIPIPRKRYRTLTTKHAKEVARLKNSGMTFRMVAEETGIPLSSCICLYRGFS